MVKRADTNLFVALRDIFKFLKNKSMTLKN